jgi:hypothetical protein
MSDTVIRQAARALNPNRPIMTLVDLARRPRSTVRSWTSGHRRPSIAVLKILRDALTERQAYIGQLVPELEHVIMNRERESPRLTGFNEVRERDGPGSIPRDGRNRLGRPKQEPARLR